MLEASRNRGVVLHLDGQPESILIEQKSTYFTNLNILQHPVWCNGYHRSFS
jgi:hypothetical protein